MYQQPVQSKPAAKVNGLCSAGFVLSLLGLFLFGITSVLGLIFSVIGLIVAGKKKQGGKGKAIAGIIMSVIMIAGVGIFYGLLRGPISDKLEELSNSGKRRYYYYPSATTDPFSGEIYPPDFSLDTYGSDKDVVTDDTGDTEPDDLPKMGDSITGTVTLTYGTWEPWIGGDADQVDDLIANYQMQNVDSKAIIRLMTFDYIVDDESLLEYVENNRQSIEDDGGEIIEYEETTIGGYDAYIMTGFYPEENELLTVWIFADNDNYLHGVAVDYDFYDNDTWMMVRDTYTLE